MYIRNLSRDIISKEPSEEYSSTGLILTRHYNLFK